MTASRLLLLVLLVFHCTIIAARAEQNDAEHPLDVRDPPSRLADAAAGQAGEFCDAEQGCDDLYAAAAVTNSVEDTNKGVPGAPLAAVSRLTSETLHPDGDLAAAADNVNEGAAAAAAASAVDTKDSSGDISMEDEEEEEEEEEDYEDAEYFETSVDSSASTATAAADTTGGSNDLKSDQEPVAGGDLPAVEGVLEAEEAPSDLQEGEQAAAEGEAATEGDRPATDILPEVEKKVPLREILLRLKPASLMDEDEREAATLPPAVMNGTAGSAEDVDLSLGGGAAAAAAAAGDDISSSNKSSKRAACLPAETKPSVQLLNSTGLLSLVSPNPNSSSRAVPAACCLMFFFSPACQFSVAAAPHVLAMARSLHHVIPVYGIDSVEYHSINAQYGVMGTPMLLLFHNGHSVAHYNFSSYHPDLLLSFLRLHTNLSDSLNFTAATLDDLQESLLPLEVVPGSGLWLLASWLFLLSVASGCFLRSAFCQRILEAVLNNWREAEAHHHQD